jgi:hypothetical protein
MTPFIKVGFFMYTSFLFLLYGFQKQNEDLCWLTNGLAWIICGLGQGQSEVAARTTHEL